MPAPASEETRQKWKSLIEEQRQSHLPIKQWCQHRQFSSHVFRYWRNKLFPKQLSRSSFSEIHTKQTKTISLQTQGLHVRIDEQCDPLLRRQLLSLLMEVPC